jgi:lipoic acid synthetase
MNGTVLKKPSWLNKKISLRKTHTLSEIFSRLNLNTVCKEAQCPNIGECFSRRIATLLILGNVCTRNCSFCGVKKGVPEKVDKNEPERVKAAVKELNLKHVVITSVTRDDLSDGGAEIFNKTIFSLKKLDNNLKVEVLVPDFKGSTLSIKKVIASRPDIFAHNIETVPRLYAKIRKGADYKRSLGVLKKAKSLDKRLYTKSGLMLGLGETKAEVFRVFADLKKTGCDFLSLGQYLAPSKRHHPVKEFVPPDMFDELKEKAQSFGFKHVESAPYVRSSYSADKYINRV